MRVALVHDWLTGFRGGEKCLDVLCRWFPDAELFTLIHRRGATSPAIERMRISTSFLQRLPGIQSHYRWSLPLMPAAIERLKVPADVDLVISLSHAVAKSIRPPDDVPHVCYCFTPMRYAWQLRNEYFRGGKASPAGSRVASRVFHRAKAALAGQVLDRIRGWDRQVSPRVTHFIAISETVRKRIRECYDRDSQVIYPPVDTDFYRQAAVRRGDYYLCVSALVPYKRVDLAIQACNQLGRRLLIIGEGPMRRSLQQQAGPTVSFLGWRANEEVRDHLRRCRALLFPGCEDFGIVPVEAQACGAPVIAFAAGGAQETVAPPGEQDLGTGVFFSQSTPQSLGQAMTWLEQHPEAISAEKARRLSLRFSKQQFEQRMQRYLNDLMPAQAGWLPPAVLATDVAPARPAA